MPGSNSIEHNSSEANLSAASLNSQQFRLNKINEIKDYFLARIKERKIRRLSK